MGHIAGVGRSEKKLSGYEYRRVDNVTAGDRRAIEALTVEPENQRCLTTPTPRSSAS